MRAPCAGMRGCGLMCACVSLLPSLFLCRSLSHSRFLAGVKERGGDARACVRVCVCGCACAFARTRADVCEAGGARGAVRVLQAHFAYMHAARYASGLQDGQSCAWERARASEGNGEAMLVD